jgi:hypothetical protein
MVKDIGKNRFDTLEDATNYFKEVYEGLPDDVIKNVIEYCIKNPNKMPPDHEKIDVTVPPTVKQPKEVIIEGAVEIHDVDDPNVKLIKHAEGACLLSKEEAEELQEKINDALAKQDKEEEEKWRNLWKKRNQELYKEKLLEMKHKRMNR